MRILLSNDDGYFAPGLEALARALTEVGDVTEGGVPDEDADDLVVGLTAIDHLDATDDARAHQDASAVDVIFEEVKKGDWATGGVMWSERD